MTIDPTQMASKYQLAHRLIWQKLADWKKRAILEDIADHKESRIHQEFIKEIERLAESEDFLPVSSSVDSE